MIRTGRWIACCAASLLLPVFSGCNTMDRTQFQVANPAGDTTNRDRIVALVQDAAINAGMVDRTAQSKAADTLVYFEEPVKDFRTILGARSAGEYLVIDLACLHPGGGAESTSYSVTRRLLESSLKAEFGQSWRLVTDEADWIPVTRN